MFQIIDDTIRNVSNINSAIENATVYEVERQCDGRYYTYRFECINKDVLEEYADNRLRSIDYMRSPRITDAQKLSNGRWTITLTYYGLD